MSDTSTRVAIPDKRDAEVAKGRVKDAFASEYHAATTAQGKAELAKRLASQLSRTTLPADRWAIASEAIRLATDVGDASTAIPLVEGMSQEFAIVNFAGAFDALSRLGSRTSGDQLPKVVEALLRLASTASLENKDQDTCSKSLILASNLARKLRDPGLTDEVARARRRISADQQLRNEINKLLEAAKADSGNPDKALAAGLALCLKSGQWDEGLPLIARGPNSAVASLAKAELSKSADPSRLVSLADGWFDWAESQKPPYKDGAVRHAAELYQAALAQLSGLDKVKVEKRLEQALLSGGGSDGAVYLADLSESVVAGAKYGFSKDGTYMGKPFVCANEKWPKAIATIPAGSEPASVQYQVPPSVSRIQGRVGVFSPPDAKPDQQPGAPLIFEVVADGRVVWRSPPLVRRDSVTLFRVDIRGAAGIELRTLTTSGYCAWGAWLDPQLVQ